MRHRDLAGPPAALAVVAVVLLSTAPGAGASTGATTGTTSPAVPAPATSSADAAGEAGLQVGSISPVELRPGGRVVLRGRVSGGEDGLTAARVEVRRASSRSSSVSSLERWTAPVDEVAGPTAGEDVEDPAGSARTELVVELGDVAAGTSVPFTATLRATELGLRDRLGASGAYGLQLLLLADDEDGDDDEDRWPDASEVVDDERGFLLWSPEVEVEPTRLSTTVVLQGPPPLVETGLPDPGTLAASAAPGGRLDGVLTAARVLDASWVVDPVLLAGMAVAADPEVRATLTPDPAEPPVGTTTPGPDPSAGTGTAPGTAPGTTGTAGPAGATGSARPTGAGVPTGAAAFTGSEATTGPTATTGSTTTNGTATTNGSTATTGTTATGPTDGTGTAPTNGSTAATNGSTATAPVLDPAAVAAAWLDALAAARGSREVVLADWADPDPARLRAADEVDDAWAVVRAAQSAALPADLAEELLDGRVRSDVLVATEGRLSAPDLLTLAQGRSSLLLHEDLVPLRDPFELTFTPDAVTELTVGGQEFTAVLDHPGLTADLTAAVEGSPLALTRVMARLATTTLQRPNDPRLLAVALPADVDPLPGAAQQVADALGSTGWAENVSLSTALGTPPSGADREPLPPLRPRHVAGVQELLDAVEDARQVAAAVAVPEDPVEAAALDLRAAATLSRQVDVDASAELATRLREQTSATVDAVQVVPGSRVTLVAAQAALPVTVVNDLAAQVELVLEVRSRSPRLQVPEPRVPVTVEPGQRAVVDVPVVAVASGPAEVTSQLVTTEGLPWGPPSAVTVTVATQAEGRVLTGVGIGVAVLFVVGAARAFARNRRGRELVGAGPVEP